MPDKWNLEQTILGQNPLLWRKESLYKFEIEESEISTIAQIVSVDRGSIISLEPKKRSLEELFLQLSSHVEQRVDELVKTPAF